MAAIFTNNIEAIASGLMPGWAVNANGEGYIAFAASAISRTAPQGTKVLLGRNIGEPTLYTAAGVMTDQGVRYSTNYPSLAAPLQRASLLVRANTLTTAGGFKGYIIDITTSGTAIGMSISHYDGTTNVLAASANTLSPAPGETVHAYAEAIGTTIKGWIWTGPTRPATPTVTVTHSALANGYPGFQHAGTGGSYDLVDEVVVTDGAVGYDALYPETVGATVNLAISNLASAGTLSTGAATVTPAVAGVKNLAISNLASVGTLSTVAATVTPVQGTLTSDVYAAWGSPAPLAAQSRARVTVQRVADGVQVLNLANQITNGAGRLVLTNAAIVAGVWYMLGTWNADGSLRSFKAYLAT